MLVKRCNMCGEEIGSLRTLDCNDDFSIHTIIGYGSKYDGFALDIDFCSDCMDKIIDQCHIPPVIDLEDINEADPRYSIEVAENEEE